MQRQTLRWTLALLSIPVTAVAVIVLRSNPPHSAHSPLSIVALHNKPVTHHDRQHLELVQNSSVIDGSKHPELIPDASAYEILFLLASTKDNASAAAKGRAATVIRSLHLSPQDSAILSDIAAKHRIAFGHSHENGAADENSYQQQRIDRI